jgi:pimeloyl-ACP methyl ester carboxylesterase
MLRGFRARLDLMLASKEVYTRRDVARFAAFCYPFGMTPEMLDDVRRADGRARPLIFSSMMQGQMSDQRQAVETNGKPVAIVNGRHDPFVRLSYLETIGGLWRDGAKFIDGAGHAVFWDQPGVYNTLLMNFVADAAAARGRPVLRRAAG